MVRKRLIVFANSMKKGGRCVAGRELLASGRVGGWIRPISDEPDGTLMPSHMRVRGRRAPEVLQIVDAQLQRYVADRCHPEDWLLSPGEWEHQGFFPPARLAELEEHPCDLWLEDRDNSDRTRPMFLRRVRRLQSLYLVRPRNLRLVLWTEYNEHKGYNQRKTRAVFGYEGEEYDLSLTDPIIIAEERFPQAGQPRRELRLPLGDQCLLCVSLTPLFNGYHYKVVATILRLP